MANKAFIGFESGLGPGLFFGASMSVGRVVQHFQNASKVPVSLTEVLDFIHGIEPDEDIQIHGVNVNPGTLRGNCYRFKLPPPAGSTLMSTRHAVITFSTQMDICEQRLVCCKEMIHILDPDPVLTNTQAEVITLADNMASKTLPKGSSNASLQALLDSLAIWQAASILFPSAIWERVMPRVKSGEMSIQTVADWMQIPVEYAGTMMQDEWSTMRSVILKHA